MKKDRISDPLLTPSPIELKVPVGGTETFGKREIWDRGLIPLPLSFDAKLVKRINAVGLIDFGAI